MSAIGYSLSGVRLWFSLITIEGKRVTHAHLHAQGRSSSSHGVHMFDSEVKVKRFPEQGTMKSVARILPEVCIAIPALNEAATLAEIIDRCKLHSDDILVIDGHSRDKTAAIGLSSGARVIFDHKKGKGEAIRTAIPHLRRKIAVFVDADGSHDPDDIPRLVQPILDGRADHVSGSRLLGGSSELHGGFDECFRLMGSSFITACINHRFRVRLSESQNGFRAIRTDVLRALGLRENITTIEQEMIIKTLKKGYIMAEVPTHEQKRKAGYSKISVKKVAFRYVWSAVKYLYLEA